MASSVTLSPAIALDGITYSGEQWRQGDVAAMAYDQGTGGTVTVRPGVFQGATRMQVGTGSGMSVNVSGGACVIPSGVSSLNGAYRAALMQTVNLTVATSDPVSPRIDAVAVYVDDLGTSSSTTVAEVLTGTATPGANLTNLSGAPSLPVSSMILAYILVPAGSTSVTSGNILDQRTFTVAPGGIIPLSSASAAPAGNPGQYGYDALNDRLVEIGSSGATQARTLPFAPQYASQMSLVGGISTLQTICSVSITCDGSTDLEIVVTWPKLQINAAQTFYGQYGAFMGIYIDATEVRSVTAAAITTGSGQLGGGGGFTHVTQGGVDRPAAGSHNVSLAMIPLGDGTHQVQISPSGPAYSSIYVRPVPL